EIDCEKIWGTFEQAYIGRDPCDVSPEAYDPLFNSVKDDAVCNTKPSRQIVLVGQVTKTAPYNLSGLRLLLTIFARVEVKNLDPNKVKSLAILLITNNTD
ncbi:ADP-ribosyl cyclase/cyclic ADP-ribose hydrolase 1-like, partial [Clarias magur]